MTRFFRWFQMAMAGTFLGAMLQFPGADCGGKILRNVNPCGTILFCDPLEYDLAFMQDEFPDWNVDPTCTIPGFCGGTPFPGPTDITGTGAIITGAGTGGGLGEGTGAGPGVGG